MLELDADFPKVFDFLLDVSLLSDFDECTLFESLLDLLTELSLKLNDFPCLLELFEDLVDLEANFV